MISKKTAPHAEGALHMQEGGVHGSAIRQQLGLHLGPQNTMSTDSISMLVHMIIVYMSLCVGQHGQYGPSQ